MTLGRQLALTGLALLLCLFIGMTTFLVKNTQEFLDNQLASHSQDTATALGLSLTYVMKENDATTASRVVDAVWDRGFYRSITIQSGNGAPIVERSTEVKIERVPAWFVDLVKISTSPKEALIMDGWQRVGKVIIESNPGYAYQQIWQTFIDSLNWLLITGLLAVALGWMLLHIILRPLRAVTKQALEICNQKFSIVKTLPWTIDLRTVVEAMNNMSARLKVLFEDQARKSEQLREQAFKDPITKLGNRRYFDLQFGYLLDNKEDTKTGVLILVDLNNFKNYNDEYGYEAGDQLLRNVANVLEHACQKFDSTIVAHLGGASFAVVLPNKTKEVGHLVATNITNAFKEMHAKNLAKITDVGSLGVTLFTNSTAKQDILSKADMAVKTAKSQGSNTFYISEDLDAKAIHGAHGWSEIFKDVLENNKIVLHFQKIKLLESSFYTKELYEVLLRIEHDSELIAAGIFMPIVEQLNQIVEFDKLVITNICQKIKDADKSDNIIYNVNISPSSLDDPGFIKWLLDMIKSLGKKAHNIAFDFPEYGVINRLDIVRKLFSNLSQLGALISIDHYGKSFSSFGYLRNLRVNYLKIAGSFTKNIHESEDNQFFIGSLIEIAHSLDIKVIAESVESQEELNALIMLKVDGMQGYYVGKPGKLEE